MNFTQIWFNCFLRSELQTKMTRHLYVLRSTVQLKSLRDESAVCVAGPFLSLISCKSAAFTLNSELQGLAWTAVTDNWTDGLHPQWNPQSTRSTMSGRRVTHSDTQNHQPGTKSSTIWEEENFLQSPFQEFFFVCVWFAACRHCYANYCFCLSVSRAILLHECMRMRLPWAFMKDVKADLGHSIITRFRLPPFFCLNQPYLNVWSHVRGTHLLWNEGLNCVLLGNTFGIGR